MVTRQASAMPCEVPAPETRGRTDCVIPMTARNHGGLDEPGEPPLRRHVSCRSAGLAVCLIVHFGRLIVEQRVHEIMAIPYFLLVALPVVAIFVYRHQQNEPGRRL